MLRHSLVKYFLRVYKNRRSEKKDNIYHTLLCVTVGPVKLVTCL
jgi:hypothetical protein